jgi:hypothetical protein
VRLRQAVSHPFLLESVIKKDFEPEDIQWLTTELSRIQTNNPFINQIGLWCEERLKVQDTQHVGGHTTHEGLLATFDMIPHLERITKHDKGKVQNFCRRCGANPDDPFRPKVC